MSDPTGTAGLRRSFLAEANRRLSKVRSQTHTILVEHDLMAARNDPLAALLPYPGYRLSAFAQWFERVVHQQLLGQDWWTKFLQRGYHSGVVAGSKLVGSPAGSFSPLPAVYRELAQREFAGIAAALVQQVTRQAAAAAIGKRKALPMYQMVLSTLRKVGQARLKLAVNAMTVQLHNAARFVQFRAAGVTRVGIDPERIEPRRRSRFLQQLSQRDHWHADASLLSLLTGAAGEEESEGDVDVMTAGDDRVCPECEAIALGGPYTLGEAEDLIPAHLQCRCTIVPAGAFSQEERLGESG